MFNPNPPKPVFIPVKPIVLPNPPKPVQPGPIVKPIDICVIMPSKCVKARARRDQPSTGHRASAGAG
jgi:hypothetical protein